MKRVIMGAVALAWAFLLMPEAAHAAKTSNWVSSDYNSLGFSIKHPKNVRAINECIAPCSAGTPRVVLSLKDSLPSPTEWGIAISVLQDMSPTDYMGNVSLVSLEKRCAGKLRKGITLDGQAGIITVVPDRSSDGPELRTCFSLSGGRTLIIAYRENVGNQLVHDIVSTLRITQPATAEELNPAPTKWVQGSFEAGDLTFSYPDNMTVDTVCDGTPCVQGSTMSLKIPNGRFSIGFMVFYNDAPDKPIDQWLEDHYNRNNYSAEIRKLREIKKVSLAGRDAVEEIGYSGTHRLSYSYTLYTLLKNGKILKVGYSTASEFAEMNEILAKIITSIRFTN